VFSPKDREREARRLFEIEKRAEKIAKKVPPAGKERVSENELRRRWPHMGDAARAEFRMSLAKEGDPLGVNALMAFLGKDNPNA
jgi:hypothetical protein